MNKNKGKQMLLVLGFMAFLANGDNYAAATLISKIAQDLNLELSTATLSVTAYMLSFGIFTLLFGPLSDRFGKANVINTAAMGTAIFSILGAFAFNLPSLVFFRSMNGMFGAGIFPITMALVGETFDDDNRQKALGTVMGMAFLGGATATAIGGTIAYLGSWRAVYLLYGIGEALLALMMFKLLERDKPASKKLSIVGSYKNAITDFKFMRLVVLLFPIGFSVFGSFTYTGINIQELTGFNTLMVGLILSVFGVGTVIGGRIAPKVRKKLGNGFLLIAGIIGFVSLYSFSIYSDIYIKALGLFGYGVSFIFMQSTIIATAQEKLPHMKGTAMSLAAFNMFLGAGVGTSVNALIMTNYGTSRVFFIAAYLVLTVGSLAGFFVSEFEAEKNEKLIQEIVD